MNTEIKALYYLTLIHKIKSFRRTRNDSEIEVEMPYGARKIFSIPDLIGMLFKYASKEFCSLVPYNSPERYKKLRDLYEQKNRND